MFDPFCLTWSHPSASFILGYKLKKYTGYGALVAKEDYVKNIEDLYLSLLLSLSVDIVRV